MTQSFLQNEDAYTRELVESLPGIFYLIDANGRFLMWNSALERVLGCTATELECAHPLEFFAGEDVERIEAAIRQVFETGETQVDAVLLSRNGSRKNYHFTGRRLIREGVPVLVGLGQDTSSQQQLLHESNALLRRYQTLLQNSMEGIHIMDIEGNVVEANDAFCNMLGYSQAEILCMNVMHWNAQWSSSELKERFLSHIGTSNRFETFHRRKDGSIIQVEIVSCGVEIDGKALIYAASRDITERKLTEDTLRIAATAFESQEGMVITDRQNVILRINKAFSEITGYSAEELVGQKMNFFNSHRQDADFYHTMWKSIRSNGGWQGEIWNRVKSGDVRPHQISITAVKDSDNFVTHYIGSYKDITERKKAEDALRYSEQRFRDVSDAAGEYLWELDANLIYTYVSNRSVEVKGYTPAELVGHSPSEFMPEDDVQSLRANVSINNQSPFKLQHRTVTKSGVVHWEEVSGVPYFDEQGTLLGLRGTGMNITGRKMAEEQLRIAAVAFETHDAILITDANANIIRVNRAFQEITGYSAEEVTGKNPRILSSGQHDKAFYTHMWSHLLNNGTWSGEVWDKRKNGQIYPKWLSITAVKDDDGNTTEYVAMFSDITGRKQAEEEIKNLAFFDALTKLPNRRLLMDRLRSAMSTSSRNGLYGAVLFLDMDRFKTLNDTLGHDYGDLLLIDVAHRIQLCVREVDTVARLGGDEFVMIIEGIDENAEHASRKVALIAEKIRVALTVAYRLKNNEYHSSPSMGVCLYRGIEESVEDLVKHADMAMYQAKDSGRNAVRFFDPAMQLAVESRAALEADLRHAVPENQLQLYYQIQVDEQHRTIGAEALIRWNHPQRGIVMPTEFIPIAEESSLIIDLGFWVLNTACRQLAAWSKDTRTAQLTLAVNVSAKQFSQQDFVGRVISLLRTFSVKPSRLKLELTESVVVNDVKDVVAKMHELKAYGIKLSLDDFGTGYSSLAYLKSLPLDQIKIDRSFVRDITTDPNDAVVIKTIIDMADNFRVHVIAEGVETTAQLELLGDYGCNAYQGYLFSKPVPIGEFMALLKSTEALKPQAGG